MGAPRFAEKALLFTGALFSKEEYYLEALQALEKKIGQTAMESPPVKWDFSDHYRDELGGPIYRRFIFFRDLIDPSELSNIKLATNRIEDSLSSDGKRNINLDPGYLTLAKVVLASTKDYSHRIYLKDGIYAEVTLIFKKGERYFPHINTYRDYQDQRFIKIFMIARGLFDVLARG